MTHEYRIIEYPLIILFCLTGVIFLLCSYDIVSIFLSIELQSYGLYLLCSIHRNSESSINAGLAYFLLGGIIFLYYTIRNKFIVYKYGKVLV